MHYAVNESCAKPGGSRGWAGGSEFCMLSLLPTFHAPWGSPLDTSSEPQGSKFENNWLLQPSYFKNQETREGKGYGFVRQEQLGLHPGLLPLVLDSGSLPCLSCYENNHSSAHWLNFLCRHYARQSIISSLSHPPVPSCSHWASTFGPECSMFAKSTRREKQAMGCPPPPPTHHIHLGIKPALAFSIQRIQAGTGFLSTSW